MNYNQEDSPFLAYWTAIIYLIQHFYLKILKYMRTLLG